MEKDSQQRTLEIIDAIAFEMAKLIGQNTERSAHQRSDDIVQVYAAGCAGLGRIAREAGGHICKLGTTTHLDIEARLAELGRDNYAAFSAKKASPGEPEAGFSQWIAKAIATSRKPKNAGIEILPRSLKIKLPEGLTRRQFDMALHRALSPWRCGLTNKKLARWTGYNIGKIRFSRADELYRLDPARDGDRLLGLVEGILAGTACLHKARKRP